MLRILLLIFIPFILQGQVCAQEINKKDLYGKFVQNQAAQTRFKVAISQTVEIETDIKPYPPLTQNSYILDVDYNNQRLHVKGETRNDFIEKMMEIASRDKKGPYVYVRDFYFDKEDLYVKDEFSPKLFEKIEKNDSLYVYTANPCRPYLWKLMELVRTAGFGNKSVKDALGMPLGEFLNGFMKYQNDMGPCFGAAVGNLLAKLDENCIVKVTEIVEKNEPCYELQVRIPEDSVKEFLKEGHDLSVDTVPEFMQRFVIGKKDFLLKHIEYDYSLKAKTHDWEGKLTEGNVRIRGQIDYEYPASELSPLEKYAPVDNYIRYKEQKKKP